jgi:hypothetical protein
MADEKIVFKVVVDDEGNIVKLQSIAKGFNDIDLTVKNAENAAKKLNQTIAKTGSGGTLKSLKITKNEYSKLAKTQNQVSDATGSATSATMELSRVISDAPYGIRGMANNITQLVSQLGTASVKAGGLTNALKLMWSQLMGPLGIVLAITAAVSALDYFAGAQTKAKDETKDHNDELERQFNKLSELNSLQKTVSASGDGISLNWIDGFISGVKDIEAKDLVKILERDIKGITDAFNKLPESEKNLKGVSKLIEIRKELIRDIGREKVLKEELLKLEKQAKKFRTDDTQGGKALTDKIITKQKSLLAIQKEILDAEEMFKKNKETKDTETKLLEFEPFEAAAERYEDELSKLNEQTELLDAKSEVEKLQIKKEYHLARLEAQHTEHKEKYEQTAAEYRADLELFFKQEVARKEMTQEDADKRLAIFDSNTKTQIRQSEESFNVLMDITKSYYNNRITEANFAGQKLIGDGKTLATQEQENLIKHLGRKAELYKSYSDTVKSVLSGIGDFISAEFERELIDEENKNNEANKNLNDRLLNENLSKDERANIQNQIAQNDEKLRVKQEQIARKQFNVEKAFKIAMAIADTASSASKAFLGQLTVPTPEALARATAAAKVATAFGLAQVAMIARTKFKSTASSKPANASIGGGGGGNERSDPSFNIVGRSGDNLLINAIQAQFDKPLKAYVVSRDVTNQQQLDGMIVGQAGT